MGKDRKNSMNINQLKDEKLNKIHKEELGLSLPEGYFAQSKNEILSKTTDHTKFTIDWFLPKNSIWKVAASIILILGLVVYLQFSSGTGLGTEESAIVKGVPLNEINQSLVQSDSNLGNKEVESILSPSNNPIEHQKTNADHVVQNENDILVKSLFVEEDEVDQYLENSILEDI